MKRTTTIEIIAAMFMILFLYTGISKLIDYSVFKEQIAESPVLAPVAPLISILLPLAEFGIVLLLIVPKWRLKGFWASLILMVLFTIYIIAILTFNEHIPCSCGGVIGLLSWKQHIVFNSIFIVLAGLGVFLEKISKHESASGKIAKIAPSH